MRKINSKKDNDKKQKRNQIILGVLLMFIMFASVLGYSFQGGESKKKIEFNGLEFIEENGYWITEISGINFGFRNNPLEVENFIPPINLLQGYYGKVLYIDSDSEEATSEIGMNFNSIAQRVVPHACLGEFNESNNQTYLVGECEGDYPIKTCWDNLIVIEESNFTNVEQDRNCVFIRGPYDKLTELTDSFLFKVLGIE